MGLAESLKAVARPVTAPVNRKLEDLFRHVSNEAFETRRDLSVQAAQTRETVARLGEEVEPALQGVTEVASYLELLVDRVERRLATITAQLGPAAGSGLDKQGGPGRDSDVDVGEAWVVSTLGRLPVGARVVLFASRPGRTAPALACLGLDVDLLTGVSGTRPAGAKPARDQGRPASGMAWSEPLDRLTTGLASELRRSLAAEGVLAVAARTPAAHLRAAEERLGELMVGWSVEERRVAFSSGSGWRTLAEGERRDADGAREAVLLWRARPA